MTGERPKLPAKQLAILAVARFAEPLAMTSVFPYLPEMIQSFGVGKKDVAKWAGATSAVFSLAQSVTAVSWGRASDRFGRKPVILTGLFCTMACFLLWGVSTSLPMAIAIRAIQGGSNGNVGIIRTMVAEMVTEKELQPRAFSIMPLVWSIGSIFGPALGGFFAKPTRFPIFADSAFFTTYPFMLPNLVCSIIFMISLATGFLFLKETLASKRDSRDVGLMLGEKLTRSLTGRRKHRAFRRYSFQDDEATAPLLPDSKRRSVVPETPVAPSMKSVFVRQSVINLIAYTFLALHSVAYDQVLPVFLNYPQMPHDDESTRPPFIFTGGFGLDSGSIGSIFTFYGLACGLIQFLIFPPLCSYFGVLNCFRGCALTFPLVYLLTPYTVLIEDETIRFMALMVIMVVKAFAVIVGFPCTTILLTNSATSMSILGTLNGFATTFSALGRALGPAITGSAFSWGVKRGVIAVPWWILAAIAALGAVPAFFIVEGNGPSGASLSSSEVNSDDDETAVDDNDEDDVDNSPQQRSQAIVIEGEGVIPHPGAQDDLPLVGSMKSANSIRMYGSFKAGSPRQTTGYGAVERPS